MPTTLATVLLSATLVLPTGMGATTPGPASRPRAEQVPRPLAALAPTATDRPPSPLQAEPRSPAAPTATDDPPPTLLPLTPAPAATDTPPPSPQQDPPAADTRDEATRSAAARKHQAARRHREAAQQYEQLWQTTRDPRYLLDAGTARAAAGHHGAAIVHWQRYLVAATRVPASERSKLTGKIAAARKRTRPIQLHVQGSLTPSTLTLTAPDGATQGPRDPLELLPAATVDLSLETGDWIATLRRPDRPDAVAGFRVAADAEPVVTLGAQIPPPLPPPIEPPEVPAPPPPAELTITLGPDRMLARGATIALVGPESRSPRHVRDATTTWQLAPGDWRVQVDSPGRARATASTVLGPGERRGLSLHLRRDRPSQVRIGLGAGLGGAGLLFLTAGAVVAARAPHRGLECADEASCRATADAVLTRSIGFSLIGAGLGAAAPALTAAFVRESTDTALIVEAGVGALLLAGGVGWYLGEVTRTTAIDHIPRQHAAATLRGLGGGMLGGAVIGLVVRRLTRGKSSPVAVAPTITPHSRGLALQASF